MPAVWKRFLYLVLLLTAMGFISHGTQDLYPTFLQQQRHFTPSQVAVTTMLSMVGAIIGGLVIGRASDWFGRRRAMIGGALGALAVIPLWVLAPSSALLVLGGFLMQFFVQGAWGVIPAHMNELSPGHLRGFFPGFAYQLGMLCAGVVPPLEALIGEHFSYATSMGGFAAGSLIVGCFVIGFGPEAHGVSFRKQTQRLVVLALLLCAGSTVCLAQEPQAVVDRFHPQQLTTSRAAGPTCFMVLRLTSINEPDAIVAAYTDGTDVALRLLTRVAPDTYVVSYGTKSSLPASATSCSFTGPDLDGDGQPDVKLEVASGAVSSAWGFKWTGDTLVPRSVPTSR